MPSKSTARDLQAIRLAAKKIEGYLRAVEALQRQVGPGALTVSDMGRKGGLARSRALRDDPERRREIARLGGLAARGKKRSRRSCSVCRAHGHDRRTCPVRIHRK